MKIVNGYFFYEWRSYDYVSLQKIKCAALRCQHHKKAIGTANKKITTCSTSNNNNVHRKYCSDVNASLTWTQELDILSLASSSSKPQSLLLRPLGDVFKLGDQAFQAPERNFKKLEFRAWTHHYHRETSQTIITMLMGQCMFTYLLLVMYSTVPYLRVRPKQI